MKCSTVLRLPRKWQTTAFISPTLNNNNNNNNNNVLTLNIVKLWSSCTSQRNIPWHKGEVPVLRYHALCLIKHQAMKTYVEAGVFLWHGIANAWCGPHILMIYVLYFFFLFVCPVKYRDNFTLHPAGGPVFDSGQEMNFLFVTICE